SLGDVTLVNNGWAASRVNPTSLKSWSDQKGGAMLRFARSLSNQPRPLGREPLRDPRCAPDHRGRTFFTGRRVFTRNMFGSWSWWMRASPALALGLSGGPIAADPAPSGERGGVKTETPIKHVIVVIGENRSFDHVYGTYVPHHSQSILNLLSQGIVRADGSPGPNFAIAKQFTAEAQSNYYIGVTSLQKTGYSVLPPPTLGGAP